MNPVRAIRNLIALCFLMLSGNIYAQCAGDGSSWSWDNTARLACAPCSYTSPLTSSQKLHDSCRANNNSNSTYVGLRIRWTHDDSSSDYLVDITVNGRGFNFETGRNREVSITFASIGVSGGEEVCAAVTAVRNNVYSEQSQTTCLRIPVVVDSGNGNLAAPSGVQIILGF